jgi:hypothetical protein
LSEATADCDALGGYLWTTTSLTEAKDVNKVLNNGAAPIWLSFRTVAAPAPFSWPTGESIQYQAWAQNQPSDVNLSCVLQTSDATFTPFWQSAACTEKHDYVCETEPALVFAATHHAYHLHTRFRPWAEARDACAASGGHLLTIESAAEQAFISRYFAVEIWLGASRQSDGSFRWLTGLALDYSAFAKGQPDNSAGKENCLVDWASHAWNDLDCTVSRRFVCEFD